jgi:hypothetical protein
MKKTMLSAIFILCFLIPIIDAAPIYYPGTGHYYERVNETIEWPDAKTAAEQSVYLGIPGHLATITTPEEDQWIQNNLGGTQSGPGYETPFAHFLGGYQEANASHVAEGWIWITGEPWDFTNWSPGEPDDENNQSVLAYNGLYWSDTQLDNHWLGYVVEYDPAVIPEPSTIFIAGAVFAGFAAIRRKFKKRI